MCVCHCTLEHKEVVALVEYQPYASFPTDQLPLATVCLEFNDLALVCGATPLLFCGLLKRKTTRVSYGLGRFRTHSYNYYYTSFVNLWNYSHFGVL